MDYGRRCIGSQSKVVSLLRLVINTEVSDVLDNFIKLWGYYYFWRFSVLVERFMLLMGMKSIIQSPEVNFVFRHHRQFIQDMIPIMTWLTFGVALTILAFVPLYFIYSVYKVYDFHKLVQPKFSLKQAQTSNPRIFSITKIHA